MEWDRENLTALLESNNLAVEKALLRLYERQTRDEQSDETVRYRNDIGFRVCDAKRASYWVRWIKSGRHLTGKHLVKAREVVKHYHRQLLEIVDEQIVGN